MSAQTTAKPHIKTNTSRHHRDAASAVCRAAHLAGLLHHDVVTVPVTDAKDVRGYTVASTGQGELLNRSVQVIPGDRQTDTGVRPPGCGMRLNTADANRTQHQVTGPSEHMGLGKQADESGTAEPHLPVSAGLSSHKRGYHGSCGIILGPGNQLLFWFLVF